MHCSMLSADKSPPSGHAPTHFFVFGSFGPCCALSCKNLWCLPQLVAHFMCLVDARLNEGGVTWVLLIVTLVLLSLNSQHHFLTLPSLIVSFPYTEIIAQWISAGPAFLVQSAVWYCLNFTISRIFDCLVHFILMQHSLHQKQNKSKLGTNLLQQWLRSTVMGHSKMYQCTGIVGNQLFSFWMALVHTYACAKL